MSVNISHGPLDGGEGVAHLVAMLRRRWRWFASVALAGLLITFLVAFGLPSTYRSSGTILIEQQDIPQDIIRSTVTAYADQRLQVIRQRVMTASTLLDMIERFDLYSSKRDREPRERLLERIESDIGMDMMSADVVDPRSGRFTTATIAFTVSFDSESPSLAYRVANELTSLYLAENRKTRAEMVEETTSFLQEEADKLNGTISQLEAELAAFKEQNVTQLPELMELNLQLLHRSEQELIEIERQIHATSERQSYLQALSESGLATARPGEPVTPQAQLAALRTQQVSASAVYSPDHPDLLNLRRQIASLEAAITDSGGDSAVSTDLAAAREALQEARSRYSPEHPDVRRLEREVAELEASASGAGASTAVTYLEPGQLQTAAQVESAAATLRALLAQRARLQQQISTYQQRLLATPGIERQYRELARDHENEMLKYKEIKNKLIEAQLAQSLEAGRRAERFTVIEPPARAESPVWPNRPAILFIGIVLALAAGFVAAVSVEHGDRTVRGPQQFAAVLGFAPLTLVPEIVTAGEAAQHKRRRQLWLAGTAGAAVLAAIGVHLLVLPLDTLWFLALRELGL